MKAPPETVLVSVTVVPAPLAVTVSVFVLTTVADWHAAVNVL